MQEPQLEAWAPVPTVIPAQARGSQAQPGSHALRCAGGRLKSLGAPRPGRQHHPQDTTPPPGPPLGGPCLDGSTASGQPPAPQPSPHRTASSVPREDPHLQQHPQAPPPRLSACHKPCPNPSAPFCLSPGGIIWLLPRVCGRPSPAMGTPGSSVGSVSTTNVGMDAEGRPGRSRNKQLEEGEDGRGEGS